MLLLLELWAVLRLQCLMFYKVAMLMHAGCCAAGGAVIMGPKLSPGSVAGHTL